MDENNRDKKNAGSRVEDFFAGKGFYIVLLLCVSVIGVSAWSMISGGSAKRTEVRETLPVSAVSDDPAVAAGKTLPAVVAEPPHTAAPKPAPSAAPTSAPTAAPKPTEAPKKPVETQAAATPTPTAAPKPQPAASYFIWPVSGTVENDYSMTALVFDRTMQDWRTHDGVDIAADLGTQVRAAAAGTVSGVYYDERMGATVTISHGGGVESLYANLAGTPTVSAGEVVGVGQVIGAVGDTALFEVAEVSHLHFAMTRDGQSADPGEFLPQNG